MVLATNALTGDLWSWLKRRLVPLTVYHAATPPLPPEMQAQILKGNPALSAMHNDMRDFHCGVDSQLSAAAPTVCAPSRRRRAGRGVALALSYRPAGAGRREDAQMPMPVTGMRKMPLHPIAVQFVNRVRPLGRLRDRLA